MACGSESPARLTNTHPSKEALAQAVVDAVMSRDRGALAALAVTEAEFRAQIWPRLPASRPEMGMPVDYLWADTSTKSRSHLARLLAEHGGRRAVVAAVRFGGPTTDYGTFRVSAETVLTLRDQDGRQTEERWFGSAIESAGGWKVYSYVVD
jgi:hypothetical protein